MHDLISNILENWTSFYSNHALIRTLIGFAHIGGLVIGGGCAISADRLTLRAARCRTDEQTVRLDALQGTHTIVLVSLGVVMISGLLLFGADVDNLLHSLLFWLKMGMVAALMMNGAVLVRAERHVQLNRAASWRTLTITSMISVALWMLTTLVGAALPNMA